jgi:1,4-dihydroxy-2-naphthoate octaprenyltransferase
MKWFKLIMGPMRLPFLILTPACILLGIGTAIYSVGYVNKLYLVLIIIGGIAAHISVNTFNEYFDFKSGLDFRTKRSPFNGGSGTLIAHPEKANSVLFTAWISLTITAIIGIYFILVRGWMIVPLGLAGLILVYSYTIWITRNPLLCLVAPGSGFGIIMVTCTHFVLTGEYSLTSFVISLVPFFLVNNLLLLNQIPDIQADRSVGRRNFPIIYGRQNTVIVYGIFLILTYLVVIIGVYLKYIPLYCLIGLLSIVLAIPTYFGVAKNAHNSDNLQKYLGFNVVINIATPVLISIGFFLA